jgi:hypothetical protein
MKKLIPVISLLLSLQSNAQDLIWSTSAIPNNSTSFNFGSIGSPASTVNYNVTGPGTLSAGPTRFTTTHGDISWRTSITFASVSDLKVYTLTFSPSVCNLSFLLYDIDGTNTSGDRAIVTATNFSSAQNITITPVDASPPTITGSPSTTATVTGTQGNQTDNRVTVSIPGCVSSLVIRYGNNPAGSAGNRSFSIGNLSWSGSTLPVALLSFNGKKRTENSIELQWSTASETNLEKYEIERSLDGITFNRVGEKPANNTPGAYNYTDFTPAKGTIFYRLKALDKDGRYEFSNIIVLKFNTRSLKGFTLFPNPAKGNTVFVAANNNEQIERIQVFDYMGQLVHQQTGSVATIQIQKLSKGIYRVKLFTKNGEVFNETFIKD